MSSIHSSYCIRRDWQYDSSSEKERSKLETSLRAEIFTDCGHSWTQVFSDSYIQEFCARFWLLRTMKIEVTEAEMNTASSSSIPSAEFPRTGSRCDDVILTSIRWTLEVYIHQLPALAVPQYEAISTADSQNVQIQLSPLFSPQNTCQNIRHGPKSEHTTCTLCPQRPSSRPFLLSADLSGQLNDQSLFKPDVAYVNGEWVKAKSGKSFKVHGGSSSPEPWRPTNLAI